MKTTPWIRYKVALPVNENQPAWVGQTFAYFNERQKKKAVDTAKKHGTIVIDLFTSLYSSDRG